MSAIPRREFRFFPPTFFTFTFQIIFILLPQMQPPLFYQGVIRPKFNTIGYVFTGLFLSASGCNNV